MQKFSLEEIQEIYGINLEPNPYVPIKTPKDVFGFAWEKLRGLNEANQEGFYLALLNTANEIIWSGVITVGTLNSTAISPKEIFSRAITRGANSIVIAHNHPSGRLDPSSHDAEITKRLIDAGRILTIEVLDHLIVSQKGFTSLKEKREELWK